MRRLLVAIAVVLALAAMSATAPAGGYVINGCPGTPDFPCDS